MCPLTAGVLSDLLVEKLSTKMRSSPRLLVILFCSVFVLPWLYLVHSSYVESRIVVNVACFMLGLCCYGPHILYGLLVIENSPAAVSGTVHGLSATVSTVGSVLSGYPLSRLIDQHGWNGMFTVLAVVAVLNSLLLVLSLTFDCKMDQGEKKDQ